jgi:hypothetical protein
MITRGVGDIKGIRRVNTRPGPVTESSGLLALYRLATEKDSLQKKLAWVRRQQDQTEKRLSEIAQTMQAVKKTVEARTNRELASDVHSDPHNTRITY